ncbi:putative H/ACA ribonucleoprotein complex subunit 2-like protein [Apostichopus japonicus]|uniref:Putative H/ACA ribonucleoprotein complex subunit 2-like protein n=1 Tax=Stichopus japonicus TaxID=307972 RepID=A0A2G8LEG6_STIJA|nr:putative H/ACA ribonucleoprotein complex subunit 2-like protein [Apostichopus japonicus]
MQCYVLSFKQEGLADFRGSETGSDEICSQSGNAHKAKNLRRGVIDVQKFIRKGERGFVVFAGDVTPIEVMCHLPAVCEEKDIPYCYVPSKEELGTALDVKRTVCCVLVKESDDYKEHYDECFKQVKSLPPPI